MDDKTEKFIEEVTDRVKAQQEGVAYVPPTLTPDQLMEAIQHVQDGMGQTIFCHPMNVRAVEEWKTGYEYGRFITIVPSPYVPHDQLFLVPTKVIQRPSWMS